ncbi:MAG TPA: hypothetical protein VLE45_09990 [Burkholderiaceae bacterium]|nr:hypothetical protein [Burkholderiaceae bacterium]
MPYFVYRVKPFAQLEKLAEFSEFAAASAHAKALRARLDQPADRIRIMFAEHQQQAEDLLCEVRDARPAGDD